MKVLFSIALLALLPAMAVAQRESIKSSNKYNSAAMRVPDKEKQKALTEKVNGQRPDQPAKPKPKSKTVIQGPTENGNRFKSTKPAASARKDQ
jgi:hypothetical protein